MDLSSELDLRGCVHQSRSSTLADKAWHNQTLQCESHSTTVPILEYQFAEVWLRKWRLPSLDKKRIDCQPSLIWMLTTPRSSFGEIHNTTKSLQAFNIVSTRKYSSSRKLPAYCSVTESRWDQIHQDQWDWVSVVMHVGISMDNKLASSFRHRLTYMIIVVFALETVTLMLYAVRSWRLKDANRAESRMVFTWSSWKLGQMLYAFVSCN